ncbi:MAG TPA: hypothetical protein VLK23_13660 [Thermodesulfobacteriota bacterium]|nr:hypothetical protein [Thermodesulfobacteriota bacterium]
MKERLFHPIQGSVFGLEARKDQKLRFLEAFEYLSARRSDPQMRGSTSEGAS